MTIDMTPVPLISWEIASGFRQEVGDCEYSVFVHCYVRLWPDRYGRLVAALRDRDGKRALEAVLTIRSSSETLGALQVAHVASVLERAVRERVLCWAGADRSWLP